jgi:signal transduction histidine kinase
MLKYFSLTVRGKIFSGYALVAFISILVGLAGYRAIHAISESFTVVEKSTVPVIEALEDLKFSGLRIVSSVSEYGLIKAEASGLSPNERNGRRQSEDEIDLIKAGEAGYRGALTRYLALTGSVPASEAGHARQVEADGERLLTRGRELVAYMDRGIRGGRILEAKEAFEASESSFLGTIDLELGHHRKLLLDQEALVASAADFAMEAIAGLSLLAFLIAFLVGRVLSGNIAWRLEKMREAAADIQRGNLDVKVRDTGGDELAALAGELDIMAAALRKKDRELALSYKRVAQSEKMSAVGRLAAGVAHEINNPLGIILGFAQSAAQDVRKEDALALPLRTIEREAFRCRKLVQDLLTFSRAGNKEAREVVDLNSSLEPSLSLVETQIRTRNISLVRELAAGLPSIRANRTQLQQALLNLATNAVDAMPKGGTLTITTALSSARPGCVEVLVRDTGAGIPKDVLGKIFDPFFTTKEVGKGTGLGLSLVYEIVERHGGSIKVESDEGKGSLFTMVLPAAGDTEAGTRDVDE